MTIKNAYTVIPGEIEPGDEFIFIIKAMVQHDGTFKVYRCLWTPKDHNPYDGEIDYSLVSEYEKPQGQQVYNDSISESIFPALTWADLKLST